MIEQLKEQIKAVQELRVASKNISEALSEKRDQFTLEWKNLIDSDSNAKAAVAEEETKLRELTLQAYAETGNKAPADGVGIREVTKLDYDEKGALTYAKEHLLFLQLNKKAFEKFAKDEEPDFVTITQEPQATIATNLDDKIKG